jgi:hypothetical protein
MNSRRLTRALIYDDDTTLSNASAPGRRGNCCRRTTQSGTAKSRFLAPLRNEVTLDPLKVTGDGCQDILTASQQTRRR